MLKALGRNHTGERLVRIKNSPNYREGIFQNISPTQMMAKDASGLKLMRGFLNKSKNNTPPFPLKGVKTDLKNIKADQPTIVWFGHSSYFIKHQQLTILVDPVFSGSVSPVSFFGKAFAGADLYSPHDFPEIDILILTHDHYDHLDFKTIRELHSQVKHIYTPLGVGAHLEYWGVDKAKITELDWWESTSSTNNIKLTATTARHFSGRSIKRNTTLWASYVLELPGYKIYLGGDSGYDSHFKEIGDKFGPFDLAILETGQYNEMWPLIHMMPEEAIIATQDLKANLLLPVHWSKFALAYHDWDEPIIRVVAAGRQKQILVTTPQIGEPVILGQTYPQTDWWNR